MLMSQQTNPEEGGGEGDKTLSTSQQTGLEGKKVDAGTWRAGLSHAQRFQYILENELFSPDVTFVVGEYRHEVKAHKFMLKIASPHFMEMFENAAAEEFEMPNYDHDGFKAFLKYVYTGEVSNDIDHIPAQLQAAQEFKIPDLFQRCVLSMEKHLNPSNAIQMLLLLKKFMADSELLKYVMKCILEHGYMIFQSHDFLELDSSSFQEILRDDGLQVIDEVQVFEAVIRWGNAECQRRDWVVNLTSMRAVLAEIIPLVRFPQMDPSDFAMKVGPSHLLAAEQAYPVLLYLNATGDRTTFPVGTFITRPRVRCVPKENHELILNRLIESEGGRYHECPLKSPQSIRFKVNAPIWITSIGVNRSKNPTMLFVYVEIKETNRQIILESKREFFSVSSEGNKQIHFNNPALIRAGKWYTATFMLLSTVKSLPWNVKEYQLAGNAGSLDFDVDDGTGRVIHFDFENDGEHPFASETSINKGYIPTIGFMVV